jgi:tetratricopeptide (TPR) repeat protein
MGAAEIRTLVRLGRYGEAAQALGDGASPLDPLVVVEACRGLMMRGHVDRAVAALDAGLAASAGVTEGWALLAIERAGARVFASLDFWRALADGEKVLARARTARLTPTVLARLDRVWARIVLGANVYGEATPDAVQSATNQLAAAVDCLEAAGQEEEALLARMTGLSSGLSAPWAASEEIERRALAATLPSIAADARMQAARTLRQNQAPAFQVREALDRALFLYRSCDHAHGPLEVELQQALLDDDEGTDAVQRLLEVAKGYEAQEHVKGTYEVLHEMTAILQEQGIAHRAPDLFRALDDLPRGTGLGVALPNFYLRLGEIMQRQGRFAEAIRLLRRGLETEPPRLLRASLEQTLAQAYILLGLPAESAVYRQRAAETLRTGPPSRAAASLADLVAQGERRAADSFTLGDWTTAAQSMRADSNASAEAIKLHLDRFLFRPEAPADLQADAGIVGLIEALIDEGLTAAARGRWRQQKQQQGNLLQLRGHLRSLAGALDEARACWTRAAETFAEARLFMEHAGSRFKEGIFLLDREQKAGPTLTDAFGAAERALNTALDYYAEAGMRRQAVDTRYMLARVWLTAAEKPVAAAHRPRLIEAVLELLENSEADLDGLRRDFLLEDAMETQEGKLALIGEGRRTYDLAIRTCLAGKGDVAAAWRWARRNKSRVLLDLLVRTRAPLAPERAPVLRAADEAHRPTPALDEIMDVAAAGPAVPPPVVLVDWRVGADDIHLFTLRRGDREPAVHRIPISPGMVEAFVQREMGRDPVRRFRDGSPRPFNDLAALVAPLAEVAQPGDRLVFSPSGPLARLPLHALPLAGEPVIARHPVSYVPSLDLLPVLAASRHLGAGTGVALFGDPEDDSPSSRALVAEMERRLGVAAKVGAAATVAAMLSALRDTDIVHFQGHAEFVAADPLASALRLSGGKLTARDLFHADRGRSGLVVLAACESAVGAEHPGDESLGLLRAFFFAGAQAVVGTFWRVPGRAAADLMRAFYAALLPAAPAPRPSVADALRSAVLAVRAAPETGALYHWAPFFVSGQAQ